MSSVESDCSPGSQTSLLSVLFIYGLRSCCMFWFLPYRTHESLTTQTCTTMTYRFVDAENPIDQYEALNSDHHFLCVEQARGGTFGFTSAAEAGPADLYLVHGGLIGTQWCNTYVGVFFRVDKHRSFITHANAWSMSAPPLPRNYVDESAGEEIRAQVFRQLETEASEKRWDTGNEHFGETLVVCCPHPESSYGGKVWRIAGFYVIRGIRDYLNNESTVLQNKANERLQGAVRICGVDGRNAKETQSRVQKAMGKVKEPGCRRKFEKANDEIQKSIQLQEKARFLASQAHFVVQREPHGFIVEHRDGEVRLAKYICGDPGTIEEGMLYADDLGGYRPIDLPDVENDTTQRWMFSSKEDQDTLIAKQTELGREFCFVDELTGRSESPDSDASRGEYEDLAWQPRGPGPVSWPSERGRMRVRAPSAESLLRRQDSRSAASPIVNNISISGASKQGRIQSASGVRGEKAIVLLAGRLSAVHGRDTDSSAETSERASAKPQGESEGPGHETRTLPIRKKAAQVDQSSRPSQ